MASITFQDAQKIYPDGTHAVRDLSLEIADQEFMILVGPSGCGKSTALRMIAGLEDISAGKLLIGDEVVNDLSPKERDIAMVFQSYALYPHMSVADNMGFALKLAKVGKDEIDKRVGEAADILGLTEYLDKKPRALSGGQRQRVAMGRAIVRSPQAFLMDEPLSNLDAKLRVQMRAEIASLQNRLGVTTVYVTHDQVEAMTMGDRVAVLSRGAAAAGRRAADPLRPPRQPVRRRVHRLTVDEHRPGADPARRRRAVGGVRPWRDPAAGRRRGARALSRGRRTCRERRRGRHPPGALRDRSTRSDPTRSGRAAR
jgi:ABC-type sugar transport system ATPase subunit